MRRLLFYISLFILIIPNICLSILEPMSPVGALANVFLPLGVIYILMTLSTKIGRTVLFLFPLMFLAAFQLVLLSLYGRSVIAVDMFLNLATTNSAEVSELLMNMLPILCIVIILYLPPVICAIISIHKKWRLSKRFLSINRKIAYGITIVGIVLVVCSYGNDSRYAVKRELYPVNALYNVYLACDRTVKTANYYETSKDYCYNSVCTHPEDMREVYMLIIGETSRADNWQLLDYDRPTNPLLSKRNDILFSSGAMSESNTTHKSVPMLLSPIDAISFNEDIYKTKSLITAFKEAGYSTAFISNQRYNRSFIDFFANEADTTIFIREMINGKVQLESKLFYDIDMMPFVDMILSQGNKKQLIVLHTYGSHFNYNDRYDKLYARFKPYNYKDAMKSERDKLVNAYDNTIVATDSLISECVDKLESLENTSAGLLYTSDHGEDIFDNGTSRFLHASPLPTYFQLHVPMIGWFSEEYRNSFPESYNAAIENFNKEISTSCSFCPTAIQMAGLETPKIDPMTSLMSESYLPRRMPIYLSDHNTPVILGDIILK